MSVQAARLIARYESQTHVSAGGRTALARVQANPDTTGDQQTAIARILQATIPKSGPRERSGSTAGEARDRILKRFATEQAGIDQRRLHRELDTVLQRAGASGANLIGARNELIGELDADATPSAIQEAVSSLIAREPTLFDPVNGSMGGRHR